MKTRADPYLALDVELAAVFGDDPLEWANASSERSVAMKAVDRLLAKEVPALTRDFSEALVYEVAGASVEVYSDRIALVPGKVDGYAFIVALLRATPTQVVRAVIAVMDGDVHPVPVPEDNPPTQHAFTNLRDAADNLKRFASRLGVTVDKVTYRRQEGVA